MLPGRWRSSPPCSGAGEEVVPASDYRALQEQIGELQRVMKKPPMKTSSLRATDDSARFAWLEDPGRDFQYHHG